MNKYKFLIILIIFILLGIFIWRPSVPFINDEGILSAEVEGAERGMKTRSLTGSPDNVGNNSGTRHYGTIQETMARLKRNVVVTGTITGVPGQESAMFQIDGKPDRQYKILTHFMDGFTINEIKKSYVVLRNQHSNKTITLELQGGRKGSLVDIHPGEVTSTSTNHGINDTKQLIPGEPGFMHSSKNYSGVSEGIASSQELQSVKKLMVDISLGEGHIAPANPGINDTQQLIPGEPGFVPSSIYYFDDSEVSTHELQSVKDSARRYHLPQPNTIAK